MASKWISAAGVSANEYPQLSNKYSVYGVPRTIINEVIHIEGAMPEGHLLPQLMAVMDERKMKDLTLRFERKS
jgi:protein-disulfide isomerase